MISQLESRRKKEARDEEAGDKTISLAKRLE